MSWYCSKCKEFPDEVHSVGLDVTAFIVKAAFDGDDKELENPINILKKKERIKVYQEFKKEETYCPKCTSKMTWYMEGNEAYND